MTRKAAVMSAKEALAEGELRLSGDFKDPDNAQELADQFYALQAFEDICKGAREHFRERSIEFAGGVFPSVYQGDGAYVNVTLRGSKGAPEWEKLREYAPAILEELTLEVTTTKTDHTGFVVYSETHNEIDTGRVEKLIKEDRITPELLRKIFVPREQEKVVSVSEGEWTEDDDE